MDGPRFERGSPPCEGEILTTKLSAPFLHKNYKLYYLLFYKYILYEDEKYL